MDLHGPAPCNFIATCFLSLMAAGCNEMKLQLLPSNYTGKLNTQIDVAFGQVLEVQGPRDGVAVMDGTDEFWGFKVKDVATLILGGFTIAHMRAPQMEVKPGNFIRAGGAVQLNGVATSFRASDMIFFANRAGQGTQSGGFGGAVAVMSTTNPLVELSRCLFEANVAEGSAGWQGPGGNGGAFAVIGLRDKHVPRMTFDVCTFVRNVADHGSQDRSQGGAFFAQDAAVAFTKCTFAHNVARGVALGEMR